MHFTSALNSTLGSAVLCVLIVFDYIRKYNTDAFQRRLFLDVLVFSLLAMAADFLYFLVLGIPGEIFHNVLYFSTTGYYFFQVLAYYYLFLFMDYIINKNQERITGFKIALWVIAVLHCLLLVFNYRWQFYFGITAGNNFCYGSYYFIRILISYLPIVFVFADVLFFFKNIKTYPVVLILCVLVLTGAGSTIDLVFETYSMVWPFFTGGLLYVYFFIMQTDSKIDALTGLGNRYSFNEFISKLSSDNRGGIHLPRRLKRRNPEPPVFKRKKPAESYSIAMIDMDHFKEINDTLGHLEGDNALRDMAGIIRNCARHSDFAARYGGDEFILAARAEYDITSLLGRIQSAIDELNAKNIRPYKLQISYGYDVYTMNSGASITDFLKHVDSLMYKHKNERRRSSDREQGREKNAAILS